MNEIATEKTMTTKELAEVLNVSVDAIQKVVKKIFTPTAVQRKVINGGKSMIFNEEQVILIKQEIQKHHNLKSRQIDAVSTELEVIANYKRAAETLVSMLNAKNQELQLENNNLKIELDESKEWTTLQKYFNGKGWKTDRNELARLSKTLGNLGYERKKIYSVEYESGLWSYRIKDLDEYFSEPEF